MKRALVAAIVLGFAGIAEAHKPSDAHLRLAVDGAQLAGQLSIAVRDVDGALDLDTDGNGDITWAETTAAAPRIAAYVQQRLQLASGDAPCPLTLGAPSLVDLTDGAYWTVPVTAACPSRPSELVVSYALLFDIDAQHSGIVHVESPGATKTVVIHSAKPVSIAIADPTALTAVAGAGARSLPVLALLALVTVLLGAWRAGRGRPRELVDVAVAFACAETVTCVLATAGDLVLPWDWVWPGVIGVVAVTGVLAIVGRAGGGALALELGLVSGFALAHAFDAAALPSRAAVTVIEFTVGVVLVQAIVVVATVAAVALRRKRVRTR